MSRLGPRSEHTLAALWAQVLLERVGVHDNFFELGGHSLLAIQLISRMRTALHVELSLRSFFETPTISAMAAAAGEVKDSGAVSMSPKQRVFRQRPHPKRRRS